MSTFKKYGAVSSLVMIAIGILFFVFRMQVTQFLALVIGLIILVVGAYNVIVAAVTWGSDRRPLNLIAGIILAIAGIFLLFNTGVTIFIAGVTVGILAFIAGVDRFTAAFGLIKSKSGGGYALFSGVVNIIFGILMCLAPGWSVYTLVMLTGLYFIIAGAMMLMSALKFHDL